MDLQTLEEWSTPNYAPFALDQEPGSLTDILRQTGRLSATLADLATRANPATCWRHLPQTLNHSGSGPRAPKPILALTGALSPETPAPNPETPSLIRKHVYLLVWGLGFEF